jgi:hypothetical protein
MDCGGMGASSEIFCVGATFEGAVRAPHAPQNRESGAFSVPQLAQRIEAQGYPNCALHERGARSNARRRPGR